MKDPEESQRDSLLDRKSVSPLPDVGITDNLTMRRFSIGPVDVRSELGPLQQNSTDTTFAVLRLTDLRRLLSTPASVHEARGLLVERFGKVTLPPVSLRGSEAARR